MSLTIRRSREALRFLHAIERACFSTRETAGYLRCLMGDSAETPGVRNSHAIPRGAIPGPRALWAMVSVHSVGSQQTKFLELTLIREIRGRSCTSSVHNPPR